MSDTPSLTLHILHDRAGRILAATAVPDARAATDNTPVPMPVARAGQQLSRVRIASVDSQELTSLLERHVVKGRGERATLVAAKSKAARSTRVVTAKRPRKKK